MIQRFTSRLNNLGKDFFTKALVNATAYDRIAGYFSSSIVEIAGEEIEKMQGKVRIVCNSQLQSEDVKYIKNQSHAMKLEWCESKPEEKYNSISGRLKKLHYFISTNKIEIRVLPNDVFGLIHGKAGVITDKFNKKIAFIGSMNETFGGWSQNYELCWADDDIEAINWVQNEFNYLWEHPLARPLTQFVIEDIQRISERKVIYDITEWRETQKPEAAVIESPVYRKEFGLWEHQKYFVDLCYRAHKSGLGARFVLADMVGLGKTIQLALSAQLIALEGDKPVLIIAPKTLLWQWQEELSNLLDIPSAVWNGNVWVDENKSEHLSIEGLAKCPRRIGIISQGLIVRSKEKIFDVFSKLNFDCIVVDEAHRARRKNLGKGKENDNPDPNNLMSFLIQIAGKTKSLLLATATPVQINPIEAWDLLYILSINKNFVLGDRFSRWQNEAFRSIQLVTGKEELKSDSQSWDWLRNPFPASDENPKTFGLLRKQKSLAFDNFVITGDMTKLTPPQLAIIKNIFADDFIRNYNPYIRHIIRRERKFLETAINPETNEPYLKPIEVKLFGEKDDEAIELTTHLFDAYKIAEEFSLLLGERVKSSGFIKTMLLRRVCSSMNSGLKTSLKIQTNWITTDDDEEDDESEIENSSSNSIAEVSPYKNLTPEEIECIKRFIEILANNIDKDPKYDLMVKILTTNYISEPWINRGCIIFSQYYDTISWFCNKFSADFPNLTFGLYAGSDKSGIFNNGLFQRKSKEEIKLMVKRHQIKLLFGTDAASEGLNLQALGTLINLDLPWNPTRLEQRKGRIQRIGQERSEILVYNMRYKDSVEDRVHKLLSERLKSVQELFGQLPDTLEDIWVEIALNKIEEAEKIISEYAETDLHPFYNKYQNTNKLKTVKWEDCSIVLDNTEKRKYLMKGW
jgi:superfamily II DNA or RNA helicase